GGRRGRGLRQHRSGPPGGGRGDAGPVAVRPRRAGGALAAVDGPPHAAGPAGRAVRRQPSAGVPARRPSLPGRGGAARGGDGDRAAAARGRRGTGGAGVVNVFLWHVHGSWTTAFVQGRHRYLVPVLPERGSDGLGRATSWNWPDEVREVTREQAPRTPVDVVVMQRPRELGGLANRWLGREPGRDVPGVYLEHSAPQGRIDDMRHVAADRPDLTLVH